MTALPLTRGSVVHVLMPGDTICADHGERLETLLGSCIAVILTDRHRTVGAMCHIVHAGASSAWSEKPDAHADNAIDTMYRMLSARGYSPQLCEAYVYGGGNMFPSLVDGAHVGDRNSQVVLERLRHDGLRVLFQDLGGATYRRLRWTVGRPPPEVEAVPVAVFEDCHD